MSEVTETPEVVAQLVAHHEEFRRFLERRLGSRADADEILQAAYLRSVERGGDVRDPGSAVAWFYRLLRNAIVDHWRRRGAEERALIIAAEDEAVDGELHAAICRCVDGVLPTLKPEYLEVLRRVDLDGATVAEVATELGVTANNLGVRLHRARAALRQRLEATCGACAKHACLDCGCHRQAHS
jgi:RNA polymerase sigma factor (sigma-70 family)